MACPTCDHTMQSIEAGVFWCPRCGTLKWNMMQDVPKLVARVREYADRLASTPIGNNLRTDLGRLHRDMVETVKSLDATATNDFVKSVEKAMVDAGAEIVVATGDVNSEQAIGRAKRDSLDADANDGVS